MLMLYQKVLCICIRKVVRILDGKNDFTRGFYLFTRGILLTLKFY